MTDLPAAAEPDQGGGEDRRRSDRRIDWLALGEYPVPELRKALLTLALLVGILGLFIYMVSDVFIALLAGVLLGVYMLPFYRWLVAQLHAPRFAAVLAIVTVTVPLVAILIYSWIEISGAADYLEANRVTVADRINQAIRKLPFLENVIIDDRIERWVGIASTRTAQIVGEIQETLGIVVISMAVFLFTVFYVLTDHERIVTYIRAKTPGRYRDLTGLLGSNVRAVIYGALYATFLTQLIKSGLILAMNLVWDVPLALVLAIVSFFIGFFPIVGSWSIYVPVAIYLMVFREDYLGGLLMAGIGFFGNTILLSLYLRPKIAAERSQVLNFYWMFIALVTGVYTFGIMGIVIGPVLLAILKAVFDTVITIPGTAAPPPTSPAHSGAPA
ncbi:MAG: AI-2E family transporter [Longimicrobiales bacterium]